MPAWSSDTTFYLSLWSCKVILKFGIENFTFFPTFSVGLRSPLEFRLWSLLLFLRAFCGSCYVISSLTDYFLALNCFFVSSIGSSSFFSTTLLSVYLKESSSEGTLNFAFISSIGSGIIWIASLIFFLMKNSGMFLFTTLLINCVFPAVASWISTCSSRRDWLLKTSWSMKVISS